MVYWHEIFFLLLSFILFGCTNNDDDLGCAKDNDDRLTVLEARQHVIAHRGSWKLHDLPQNSRASFYEALSLQLFGTEFDVHQTKDGFLVINHDYYIGEKEISNSSYEELKLHTLSNGEVVPTLEEFLSIYKSQQSEVNLFIELKQCVVEKVVNLVNEYDIQDKVFYISFSESYCNQIVTLGLGKYVLYLGGDLSPNEAANRGYSGISYNESVFSQYVEWLQEAKRIGLNVCIWPVDDVQKMKYYINMGVHISTDNPTFYKTL